MRSGATVALICVVVLVLAFASCDWFGPGVDDEILGEMQFLGRGYDVFGNYADPLALKAEVLDFDSMKAARLIEQTKLETSDFRTIEGVTANEYMSELSERAGVSGSYAGFSGSVEVNFSESHYRYSEYSFATVQTLIKKHSARITLDTTVATLKGYLTDNATQALNDPTVAPEDVFDVYGTHVLRGIIIGGRLDYNVSANMSQVSSAKSIGVFAEAGYDGAFSASVSSETVSTEEMSSFNSTRKKSLKVYGGSSEYGQYIINEDEQGYEPWIESIGDNPVFCDFDASAPVVPIWEFCATTERADELEAGYPAYAEARALGTSTLPRLCIVDIKIVGSSTPSPTPDGFYVIPQDLNENAGGDYIYVAYKTALDTSTSPAPVTGIQIVNTDFGEWPLAGAIQPVGFKDLNEDAGGDYIYLYFFRQAGASPIRSICTQNSDGKVYYGMPTGVSQTKGDQIYTMDTHDLNEDAGGDYIYIGWSFDYVD